MVHAAFFSPHLKHSIFLVACEPSGDALGQYLMRALKGDRAAHYKFCGVGGPLMASEGLGSIFPYTDLSVMGFAEVLPRLPRILKRRFEIFRAWQQDLPDLVITIDAPGFNLPLARYARHLCIPTIHAVAPSVWAWKAGRARTMARLYDHLWALLPFEPAYFHKEGLSCSFIGHPASTLPTLLASDEALDQFRQTYSIQEHSIVISLWPGSRSQEITRMLPLFVHAFRLAHHHDPHIIGLIPTLDHLKDQVATHLDHALPLHILGPQDKLCALASSTAALATSGTITLELACASVPMVVGYTMNSLSHLLARQFIHIPSISLPNILMNEPIVPEYIQRACTPENLAQDLIALLDAQHVQRHKQRQAFQKIRSEVTGSYPDEEIRCTVQRLLQGIKINQLT